jgi:tubulin-specific chaperone cofactor E-like protein
MRAQYNKCASLFFIYRNLYLLNLSSADINSWTDIDRLNKFPALKNLRVQNWPLWSKCESTEHERRQFVIARLPHVEVLNGGGHIGSEEREDAERAFIRHYMEKPENERPARYEELIAKHGKIDPLVNIDLRPNKKVQVKFIYNERVETRFVDVYRYVKVQFFEKNKTLEKKTFFSSSEM